MKNTYVRAGGVVTALVLAIAALTLPTAQAQPVSTRAAQVTLKASAPRIDSGKRLVLTGVVRNRPVGTKVQVQRLIVGVNVWGTIDTVKVGRDGAVRYVDRPSRGGVRKYRLVVPELGSRPRAVGPTVTVTVWKWQSLNDLDWYDRSATFQGQEGVRVESGNLVLGEAILGDRAVSEGFMTWDTRGTCTKAEALIQATDSTLGVAHVAFTVDDVVVQEGDVEGSADDRLLVRQDITSSERVGFTWRQLDAERAEVIMHEARIYCTLP